MNSETIQRYTRVVIYYVLGLLGSYGMTVPDSKKALILSIAGFAANLMWTIYGAKLSNLLKEIQSTDGVNRVEVHVDPGVIDAAQLNHATPNGVSVKIP